MRCTVSFVVDQQRDHIIGTPVPVVKQSRIIARYCAKKHDMSAAAAFRAVFLCANSCTFNPHFFSQYSENSVALFLTQPAPFLTLRLHYSSH